ncbi:MAG: hypothetical protein Q7S96_00665 [bacterium]|nr:hypothetical protein [bacterium]
MTHPLPPTSSADAQDRTVLGRLDALTEQVSALQRSIDRMRRAAYIRLALTIIVIVLPLLGLFFTLPRMIAAFGGSSGGLTNVLDLQEQLEALDAVQP